jgi:hypothetical protein
MKRLPVDSNPKHGTKMKKLNTTILTLGLAAATSFLLAGCSDGGQASHDGHDHDGDAHGAEHAAHDTDGEAQHPEGEDGDGAKTASIASQVAETVAAIKIIENPTAEQIAAAKPYTLKTCVMSGEELGSMGDPIVVLVGDQQIKLCCDGCMDDLKADPAKALAKLSE